MHPQQIAAGLLALLLCAGVGLAQSNPSTLEERLDRLERRFNESQQQHQAELQAHDQEIARLKQQLTPSPATAPATPAANDQIENARQAILKDLRSAEASPITLRTPANFNPDLAVIGDFKGNFSTLNENPARNRFDLGTVELELRAAVDPRADAVVAIPFFREVEDPLFFDPSDPGGDVETGVELEEAYLFLHDFGIPNLTAKVGRFHLRFGRQNLLHNHSWPTADNNFVNQSVLGPEAIADNGVSLSYVLPTSFTKGQYIELIAEIISGEGDEEAPIMNNSARIDSPALNTHILWNTDLSKDWNLELGGSWLTTRHNDDNQQHANLFGVDLTLLHVDPTGGFFNQLIQAEAIYGRTDISRSDTEHAWGAYVLAQQQINRDWYAGIRIDWTEDALDSSRAVWGVSPYVTWYWSEFLRFRAQYQHKDGDTPAEDTLYLQATWVFGAHPPHPYWAMK